MLGEKNTSNTYYLKQQMIIHQWAKSRLVLASVILQELPSFHFCRLEFSDTGSFLLIDYV